MDLSLFLKEELDPAVNQQRAEQVNDPVESPHEFDAKQDENGPHHQRARNPQKRTLCWCGAETLKNRKKAER